MTATIGTLGEGVQRAGRNRQLLFQQGVLLCAFDRWRLLQQAYDVGVGGRLMLPLAAMSVFMTPVTVRFIERFGVRSVMIVGVPLADLVLLTAAGACGGHGGSAWRGQHGIGLGPVRARTARGEGSGCRGFPDQLLRRDPINAALAGPSRAPAPWCRGLIVVVFCAAVGVAEAGKGESGGAGADTATCSIPALRQMYRRGRSNL